MIDDEKFLDTYSSDDQADQNNDMSQAEIAVRLEKEQAERNKVARKRIDELKEKKRLKDLLDDEEDW